MDLSLRGMKACQLRRHVRIAQVIGAEETATGAQLQNGLDAMAAMCKAWQASGIHVWCEEEGILFLQTGQTLYQIGAGHVSRCHLAVEPERRARPHVPLAAVGTADAGALR